MTARPLIAAALLAFASAGGAFAQTSAEGAVQGTTDATAAASELVEDTTSLVCTAGDAEVAVAFTTDGCTVDGVGGTVGMDGDARICAVPEATVAIEDDMITLVDADGATVSGECTSG